MSRFELPAGFSTPTFMVADVRPAGSRQRTFRKDRRVRIAAKQAFLRGKTR